MRKFCLVALALCWLAGCGERPAPIGPAAEASTADVEITLDAPVTGGDSTAGDGLLIASELPNVNN